MARRLRQPETKAIQLQIRILNIVRTEEPVSIWQIKQMAKDVPISTLDQQAWLLVRSKQLCREWDSSEILFSLGVEHG